MKKVLDTDGASVNILGTFFPVVDTMETITNEKYDTIIYSRGTISNDFHDILKYTHENTKIIIDIVSESGCIDDFLQFFHSFTQKYSNISFYLIADSEFEHNFGNNVKVCASFKLSPLVFFENFSHEHSVQNYKIDFPHVYQKETGFCCLNGRLRSHRILLLLELLKRNILKLNGDNPFHATSFLFYSHPGTIDYELYKSMVDKLNISIEDKNILLNASQFLPIRLRDDVSLQPSLLLSGEFSGKLLNLVTENVAGIDCQITDINTITFTEKAWIPFRLHQIPIYISIPGYVEQLRKLGFDLFDDVIDHSYDKEPDVVKRIKMAVDQLEIVSKIDLLDFYNKNYIRFIKNNINCESLKMEGYFILRDFILENDLL